MNNTVANAEVFSSYVEATPTKPGLWLANRLADTYVELLGSGRLIHSRIYEIGPGRGLFAERCKDRGVQYLGIDGCATVIEDMERRGFVVVQASVPPIPQVLFTPDIIFAAGVVEHLPPADIAPFFASAYSVLEPGGSLCLVAPDAGRMGVDFWRGHYTHQWPTMPRTLKQAARDGGLEVVCCERFSLLGGPGRLVRLVLRGTERLETLRLCLAPRIYLEARKTQ